MLLWDVLARSSAVLVAAALTNAALRGRSAALRHAVWACGLAGALAVAPLSWILPTWHVPLVPAFATATATPTPAPTPTPCSPLTATATPTHRCGARRRGTEPLPRSRWTSGHRVRASRATRPADRPTMAAVDGTPGAPPPRRLVRSRGMSWGVLAHGHLGARHAAAARAPGHRQPRDVPGAADAGDHVGAMGRHRAPPGAALRRPAHAVRAGRVDHHADGRRLSAADRRPAGRGGRLARRAGDVGAAPRARPHPPPRLPDAARRQHHLRALLDEPAGLVRRPRPAARARAGL